MKTAFLINFPEKGFFFFHTGGQGAVYILMGVVRKIIDFVSNVFEIVPFR